MIYFTTYEQLKYTLVKSISQPEKYATLISLGSGGLARIIAVVTVSPLELVRTKMQSQKMAFTQVRSALAITIKAEGLSGLWKGVGASLLRDVPFSALYWPCYEYLRPQEFQVSQNFAAGFVAGSVASSLTLPADVIKTRFQLELGESGVRKTTQEVIQEIVQHHGYRGLYTGLVPRLLKVAPACAIMISSYEYCKDYFKQYNLNH